MQINESIVAAGPDYWRSLDEQVDAPEFRAWLDHEFPLLAGRLIDLEADERPTPLVAQPDGSSSARV